MDTLNSYCFKKLIVIKSYLSDLVFNMDDIGIMICSSKNQHCVQKPTQLRLYKNNTRTKINANKSNLIITINAVNVIPMLSEKLKNIMETS